ncbi:hypothetical protein H0E87_004264 [Populus deltoides]|uniref:PsbP C-terminal domain-containing protein n=1 Tax=Populus deltoides TaxID=3696 RepID=A0A8T2ZDR2_POPDE|nr:hypothetical protein H0E87_004264 [Populus deltoides]
MGTTLLTSCGIQWRYHHQQIVPDNHLLSHSQESFPSRAKITAESRKNGFLDGENEKSAWFLKRRSVLVSGVSLVSTSVLGSAGEGLAVVKQGLLAGRIPGLSEPDDQGWRTYRRPDDKSGGHGVGWSPIIPYLFLCLKVGKSLYGFTESACLLTGSSINSRSWWHRNRFEIWQLQGRTPFVIVAPVLRFADYLGENATIEQIGPPEKVINAFGPEVIGENVEGKVLSMNVEEHSGRRYYQYELEPPHALITATAAGNRLYLFNVTGNGLQWKRHYQDLKRIAYSFRVV